MFTKAEIVRITAIVEHTLNVRRGHQRTRKLTKGRRQEIARQAAQTRWNKKAGGSRDEKPMTGNPMDIETHGGTRQICCEGGVPLDATPEAIAVRIDEVLAQMRATLDKQGMTPPFLAPSLPPKVGEHLKIARYTDDGLRVIVMTVLDIDGRPWYLGVRVDVFKPSRSRALAAEAKSA